MSEKHIISPAVSDGRLKQILQYRINRTTRFPDKPFSVFFDIFTQSEKAGRAILEGNINHEFLTILERSIVISTVTAIEVYYKDVLDGIFRMCSPDFFTPKLKHIHQNKYDIKDLCDFHEHQIHPLELVVTSQSFQNIEVIDKVFSKFVGKGFWNSILEQQVRRTDNPTNIVSWTNDDLEGLKSTFLLRHELVHDPARTSFLTEEVLSNLWKSAHMIWGF
jgi:hypothetical protein